MNPLSDNSVSSAPCFASSPWPFLVDNINAIYKNLNQKPGCLPLSIRLGTPAVLSSSKPQDSSGLAPFMFDWASFRGICFRSGDIVKEDDIEDELGAADEDDDSDFDEDDDSADDEADDDFADEDDDFDFDEDEDEDIGRDAPMESVRRLAAGMLLRVMLESSPDDFIVHKVDFEGMGRDFDVLPAHPKAPVLVDKNSLFQLLQKLRTQVANNPAAANTWRCDTNAASYASDSLPVQVVLIADWESLYDERDGMYVQSEVQKLILSMIKTDMLARNGIYFVICSDWLDSRFLQDYLPVITVAEHRAGGICSRFHSSIAPDRTASSFEISETYNLKHDLLSDEQVQIIQKSIQNFISGNLTDTEGVGLWKGNSAKGLRAIMGITPQGENQFFELGVGLAHDAFHALICGATGSGKSVLLREIICSLAERYSPQELRMLLLDYKEGTEFASFSKLPHVYALSIGSNPEFGLEVLKETLKEIERRGQLFKNAGNAKNLEEYRQNSGETLCRYVLVADEFQVLLNDKKYGVEARSVLNDLVRRGRAFGFNAILATQTLRDGSLDGEAKNQFACRIAMKMAENETDYFLASDNTLPATFNRKGQALLNYALGRKDANILFQSGNKEMPKKFRDTEDILRCLDSLHDKAVAENCLPSDVYIYDSDGFAEMPDDAPNPQSGLLIGLRNNMMSTPVYLSQRQLGAKILIVGGSNQKRNALLSTMSKQLSVIYNTQVSAQSPAEYLDYGSHPQVTVLHVPEGDFDLEDAVATWKEASVLSPQPSPLSPSPMAAVQAPADMDADFAELMQSIQANQSALSSMVSSTPTYASDRSRRSQRDSRSLVVAICSAADVKLMESSGLYVQDFRTLIYLDAVSYNQLSGDYTSSQLNDASALLETPRGVVSKIRLLK